MQGQFSVLAWSYVPFKSHRIVNTRARLKTTDYCRKLQDSRLDRQIDEVLEMFKDFTNEEIESIYNLVIKLYNSLESMYRELRNQ